MDRIYYLPILIPAGTPITAPVTSTVALEDAELAEIECVIPDGHCGLTGIRILQSQQQVFPWSNNSYLVANDDKITIPYKDQIQSSGMTASGYNTDIYDHSFYFRFTITDLPLPGALPEAEVVTPGASASAYIPEADAFDVNNILATQDQTDQTEPPPPQPITTTGPVESFGPIPPPVAVRAKLKPRPVRRKLGV